MEEKERFIIEFAGQKGQGFLDTKIDRTMSLNDVCNLLNQQDKRIKELEQKVDNYRKGIVVSGTAEINC